MPKRKQSSFNVDSLLDSGSQLDLSTTSSNWHRISPCQEQNIILTRPTNSNNFNTQIASACGQLVGRYDPQLDIDHFGLAGGLGRTSLYATLDGGTNRPQTTERQQAMAKSYIPANEKSDYQITSRYGTINTSPKQCHPPSASIAAPTTAISTMTDPKITELAPIMPSMAALATYSMFNWCARCNCSFRMTSDLVHHMRTHHKRYRTGND